MLRYELIKLWKRPVVWAAVCFVILFHAVNLGIIANGETKKEDMYWGHVYGGIMDDNWQRRIQTDYQKFTEDKTNQMSKKEFQEAGEQVGWAQSKIDRLYNNPANRLTEEAQETPQYKTLFWAYQNTHFKERLLQFVDQEIERMQQRTPAFDTARIQQAYQKLENNWEEYRFGYNKGWIVLQEGPVFMLRTYSIMMIVLLSILFSQEHEMHVMETLLTTKNGRKIIQRVKVKAALISALLTWGGLLITHALLTIFFFGLGDGGTFVQDFIMNVCPYLLTAAQFFAIQVLICFCASIVIALCMTLISAYTKKSSTCIIIMVLLLLLPPFANNTSLQNLVLLHPSNIVSGRYLISALNYVYTGFTYVRAVYAAPVILILLSAVCMILLHKRNPERHLILTFED